MTVESASPAGEVWVGHRRGSVAYRRLLAALFCAGVATFAQLYSPQAVLPQISAALRVGAADAALMVSAATIGLAAGVIPWSMVADRIGRVRAMSLSVAAATALGLLVPFVPGYELLLVGRALEGFAVAGVPAIAVGLPHRGDRPQARREGGGHLRRRDHDRWAARPTGGRARCGFPRLAGRGLHRRGAVRDRCDLLRQTRTRAAQLSARRRTRRWGRPATCWPTCAPDASWRFTPRRSC